MSLPFGIEYTQTVGFPRVSGDEPDPGAKFPELNAFSPRERG